MTLSIFLNLDYTSWPDYTSFLIVPAIQITSSSGCGENIKTFFFSIPAGNSVIFFYKIYKISKFKCSTTLF